ncbi:MAG TPA: SIS domain-containing protein [Brevundimonas sp.]|jgi:glucosamine--fructose-6-phosphate aminotransferase (isomerizing)
MRADDTLMFREAADAGRVVAEQLRLNRPVAKALGERLREMNPTGVLICGRGSSDHAGVYGRYLIETGTGLLVSSAAPSIASVYAVTPRLSGMICIAISQSGQSPDLLASVKAAKNGGALVIALVNVEDSPLARAADVVLPLHAGPERSVAATKSFIASLSAIAQLVGFWLEDEALLDALDALPEQLDVAWRQDWSAALPVLADNENLYVVGRGPGFGVACEAALKLKETAGLHAEAFSAAEVRHGPMALVKAGFPVLVLPQGDETRADTVALASEFATRGARVMMAGSGGEARVLTLPTVEAHAALQPILMIESFYRLAAEVSVARGYDPDRPPYLSKVTETV